MHKNIARQPAPEAGADSPAQDIFLGRQPILDKKGNLAAYELLFRSSNTNSASFVDGSIATATVINHAFSDLSIESVLGEHRGFINFDVDLLMSDLVELLPRDKIVIELLETIDINDDVVARVQSLKTQGYMLALDDFLERDLTKQAIFPYIDIVKVEIASMTPEELRRTAIRLRQFPVRLLAEKVDTHEQVAMCHELGFELFQGYYFARPSVISSRKVSPAATTIMHLTSLVINDASSEKIESVFRENPELTVSLLRIVNSVAVGARQRITSIGHALVVLGRSQLNRWLQVLMYALGDAPGVKHPSPLTLLASTRGRFMELICDKLDASGPALRERAFMVGILSLSEVLLGIALDKLLEPLPLDVTVKDALINGTGRLGDLLSLVEALESSDPKVIAEAFAPFPTLDADIVNRTMIQAMEWANSLAESAH